MLKIYILLLLTFGIISGKAQPGTYWGGNVALGIGNNIINLGLNPELVKRLGNVVDLGGAVNFNYFNTVDGKFKSTGYKKISYGLGALQRYWFNDNIVLSVIAEYNWTNFYLKDNNTQLTVKSHQHAPSLLLGLGYGTHETDGKIFFISVFYELLNNPASPYYNQRGRVPFIKAGFGFYFNH